LNKPTDTSPKIPNFGITIILHGPQLQDYEGKPPPIKKDFRFKLESGVWVAKTLLVWYSCLGRSWVARIFLGQWKDARDCYLPWCVFFKEIM